MNANEPNTTDQTTYILLNNELEKIQSRLDTIEERINNICTGIAIVVGRLKRIQYKDELKKPSLVDCLPGDDELDEFEDREGTCIDFSRVTDDQLSEQELKPFVEKKVTMPKEIYNSCLTEEQLDTIDKKEMEDYVNNVMSNKV